MEYTQQEIPFTPSKTGVFLVKGGLVIFALSAPIGHATIGLALFLLLSPFLYRYVTWDGEKPLGLMRLPVILFGGAFLLSAFFSVAVGEGLLLTLALFFMMVLGILGGRAAAKDRDFLLRFLLPLSIISSSGTALFALYQYFIQDVRRTTAFLSYTNRLGTLLLFFGFLCMGFFFHYRKFMGLLIPYGALIILAMGTTLSRAAWVGAGVAFSIIAFSHRSKTTLIIILVVILCCGILFNYQPRWFERFLTIFRYDQNMARINLWKTALYIFRDHPLTGSGPGSFPLVQDDYRLEGSRSRHLHATPHNIFLAILSDTGFIGIFALGILIMQTLYMCVQLIKGGDPVSIGLVAALGGIFFNEMFSQGLYTTQVGTVIWFAFGLLTGLYDTELGREGEEMGSGIEA